MVEYILTPIPPDNIYSLKHEVMNKIKDLDLGIEIESCLINTDNLRLYNIPEDDKGFLLWAPKVAHVRVEKVGK